MSIALITLIVASLPAVVVRGGIADYEFCNHCYYYIQQVYEHRYLKLKDKDSGENRLEVKWWIPIHLMHSWHHILYVMTVELCSVRQTQISLNLLLFRWWTAWILMTTDLYGNWNTMMRGELRQPTKSRTRRDLPQAKRLWAQTRRGLMWICSALLPTPTVKFGGSPIVAMPKGNTRSRIWGW